MARVFRIILVVGLLVLALAGGVAVWAQQAESGDFAFVPEAAQSAAGVVRLADAPTPTGDGRIFYTTVGVRHATVWETWFGVDQGELMPAHAVQPDGESDAERARVDALAMQQSQQAAEAVGLRALGEQVAVRPAGVVVAAIAPGSPAEGSGLELGDIVLSVDGTSTPDVDALRAHLRTAGVGARVSLGVHRDGRMLTIATTTMRSPRNGDAVLGIAAEQAQVVDSPRKVTFDLSGVGGPSAGLAFALQIYSAGKGYADLGGQRVAATGTLDLNGAVGPIGGVGEKAAGARRAGATLFLVPAENAAEARAAQVPGLRIAPVRSFAEALRAITGAAQG